MIATKSNTADLGCTPVSSNCVVWQGPDIPCINLCTGDTVSSVVYKVAHDLCLIKSSWDLTNLDLSCLVEFCTTVGPAPTTKTLSAVLDFIVKKVCCLNDLVEAGVGTTTPPTPEAPLTLPTCLRNSAGEVTLSHGEFTLRLGERFCTLKTAFDTLAADHETRIKDLEDAQGYTLPSVSSTCVMPGATASTPVTATIPSLLTTLETQYCSLRTILGTNSQITVGIAQQCVGLSGANALSQPGFMSGFTGWNTSPVNLAQAFQNLWITVCDIRNAVASLKNCCKTNCDQYTLNYDASANNDRTVVTLDFTPGTTIPAGFTNNTQTASKVIISDGTNTKEFTPLDLVGVVAATGVVSFTVSGSSVVGTALNTSQPYTITVIGNITDGQTFCTQTTGPKTIGPACPVINTVTATLVPPTVTP